MEHVFSLVGCPYFRPTYSVKALKELKAITPTRNKKLSYSRGTARRAMSVEILSTTAWLYEKSHLKRLAMEPRRSLYVIVNGAIQ